MGVIKNIRKECFRYKLSGVALMLCMVLTMLVSYYGVTIYKNMYIEDMERESNSYRYQTGFTCVVRTEEDIPRLPDGLQCNLKLINAEVCFDDANETTIVDIVINGFEENIPLISGYFPRKDELNRADKIAVVGRAKQKQIHDGYVYIFGEKYKVVGVAGSGKSVLYDYTTMLFLDCIGENTLLRILNNGMNEQGVKFILQSNIIDTNKVYDEYIKNNYPVSSGSIRNIVNPSALPDRESIKYIIWIYIFSFICMMFVIQFWLEQRKKEMQICRAFGFSDKQVIYRIAYSFACIMAVSMVIAVIALLIFGMMLGKYLQEYHLQFSVYVILPYFAVVFISVYFAYKSAERVLKRRNVVSK